MTARLGAAPPLIAMQGVVVLPQTTAYISGVISNCSASKSVAAQTNSRTERKADNVYGAQRSIGGKHNEEEAQ